MIDERHFSFRNKIGALLLDYPRYVRTVMVPASLGGGWVRYRNRHDVIVAHSSGRGVRCNWNYSRDLHLSRVFPSTGVALMRRALREWPIKLKQVPACFSPDHIGANSTSAGSKPDISFVIGHRGVERLPLLLQMLKSIAAQERVSFECIVVEQDIEPRVRDHLPAWVRHVFQESPGDDFAYARSWALNAGARVARSDLFVFHDNDMLVPVHYASELCGRFQGGYEVMNLKRFIFYLSAGENVWPVHSPSFDAIVENLEAGGSVAVAREAFEAIGGYDELFVGWGGEDIEFWERCRTRKVWEYAYMPIVHLWHEPQPGKRAKNGLGEATADLTESLMKVPPEERIDELVKRRRGGLIWEKAC
ncbi:MAG: glycosyltransferase family 2 protein [Kiritimatiellia bacterium]